MQSTALPRKARTRARTSSLPVLVLVFCLVTLGLVPPATARTLATKAAGAVKIGLDPAVSTIVTGDTGLEIVGSVTNETARAINDATVHVGVSGRLLDTPARVRAWRNGESGITPRTVAHTWIGAVPPGAVRQFRVQLTAEDIPWKYRLAALPMTLSVTEGKQFTAAATRARENTTIQLNRDWSGAPLRVGWVVPLTLPADPALFGPSGAARDEAWSRAIGPGSRVRQLLSSLSGQPVTWLVDPMLLDPPAAADDNVPASRIDDRATSTDTPPATVAPTSPASSTSPTSSTSEPTNTTTSGETPGTAAAPSSTASGTTGGTEAGSPETSANSAATSPNSTDEPELTGADTIPATEIDRLVTDLLLRLRGLPANQSIWWTAYDDPDVTALLTKDPALLRRDLTRPLTPNLAQLSTTRAVWPSGEVSAGQVTQITRAFTSAGAQSPVVLLPRRSVATPNAAVDTAVRRVAGTGTVVLYDEELGSLSAAPDADAGLAADKVLAATIAIYQQAPATPRSLTIALPRDSTRTASSIASTIARVNSAAWLGDFPGRALVREANAQQPSQLRPSPAPGTPFPSAPVNPLNAALLGTLSRQRERVSTIGSIVVDSDDIVTARHRALDVIGSTRWRGQAQALQQVSTQQTRSLSSIVGKVSVNPSTVNFFADSGRLAITVVNDLNRDIQGVLLRLQPRKYLLRIPHQPESFDLRANSRTSVRAEVSAVAPGDVAVDARLLNRAEVPIGDPSEVTQLKINVRPTSTWIYWVLGIVGGLVFVLGLWRSLRQGPRRTDLDPTSGRATPPDAIVATDPERSVSDSHTEDPPASENEHGTDSPNSTDNPKASPADER